MAGAETERALDELLVVLVRAGDARAAGRLEQRWRDRLTRTARRLLGDRDAAEDVVQETWLAITRGWLSLRDPARFPAWAFGILHRKCADHIRAAQSRRARHAGLDETQAFAAEAAPDARLDVDAAFAALGPEHRATALLFFGEGLTLAEIADVTGVPVGTAKSRLFHARRRLRALLDGGVDDGS